MLWGQLDNAITFLDALITIDKYFELILVASVISSFSLALIAFVSGNAALGFVGLMPGVGSTFLLVWPYRKFRYDPS